MSDLGESLLQLTSMGIPRPRAKAALKRSKGDAMSAAERVFAGEFDDVASDEEDSDVEIEPTGLQTPASDTFEEQAASSDFDYPDEYDDDVGMALGDFDEEPRGQDPYAGIFFPKDRVEVIIEPWVGNGHTPASEDAGMKPEQDGGSSSKSSLRILSRGEWMRGCPEGNEQSFLFQLYDQLTEGAMPCSTHGCATRFARDPSQFFGLCSDFPSYTKQLADTIERQCPTCRSVTCFACGEQLKGKGKAVRSIEYPSLFHCANTQGAIIGVGLHMIEETFGTNIDVETAARPAKKRKTKGIMTKLLPSLAGDISLSDSDDDAHPGILSGFSGKTAPKGVGYSGSRVEDTSGQLSVEKARAEKDERTAELLNQVSEYLPSMKRDGGAQTSDMMVHPTALALLRRRSAFVTDLLSSDSLLDMTNRGELYRALLDWLEIVSNHEALASMLAMPVMRPTSYVPGPDDETVTVTYQASASPRELLEGVVIQASAALRSLSATTKGRSGDVPEDEKDPLDESQEAALRAFCERILSARDKIDRQLEATKGKEFVKRMLETLPGREAPLSMSALSDDADIVSIYEKWAMSKRFEWCNLHNPAEPSEYLHFFAGNAAKLAGMDIPRRSVAIAKELSVLAQNVPSSWGASIFLRVDETRVDILKALIVGPPDTPYANGCFLFDIFLPLGYNNSSPCVHYMTTNGGLYRFNPNLYADGKVCLSLLGTWSGPGWIAGKSTLLQVLVSIQSLIFCEEPYLNEPAWASGSGTSASKQYSANVRRMTITEAMANNIEKPPFPFEEEIRTHFKLKAESIREQLQVWRALDDGKGTTGDTHGYVPGPQKAQVKFATAAKRLEGLLDDLESGELAIGAAAPTSA